LGLFDTKSALAAVAMPIATAFKNQRCLTSLTPSQRCDTRCHHLHSVVVCFLLAIQTYSPDEIIVSNRTGSRLDYMKKTYGIQAT
jgi:hypothetical protein